MPRIAVLSDIHFSSESPPPGSRRQGDLGAILLQRAIWRLNQAVRPDVTVVLGDLLNLEPGQSAPDRLGQLRDLLRQLESPWVVIPGNHDGPASDFVSVFGPPPDWVDAAGVRFLLFRDAEEPGYNSRRSAADLDRFARARRDWAGPIVSLQHVPLVPPGMSPTIYRLTNDAEAVAALHEAGVGLALSGHYHPGFDLVSDGRAHYAAAPALCEEPFAFLEVRFEPDACSAVRHELALPAGLGLVDGHVHTAYAYCGENMKVPTAVRLGRLFRLGGLAVTEHADHLYVTADQLRRKEHLLRALPDLAASGGSRMEAYWREAAGWRSDFVRVGLEMPSNYLGGVIADPADLERCDAILGAVHHLRELEHERPDPGRASEEYLGMVRALLRAGARVLAHPFRIFRWSRFKLEPPAALLENTVRLLREHGAAAELNSHKNEPIPAFVEQCLDQGVPLTLGSDAHHLAEVGYLFPQIDLIRRLGGEPRALWPGRS
jgi:histidinol phosphatase-like PHP family hydrolase/predicted phosphodiesterase